MALNFYWWRSLKTRVTIFTLAIFLISIWSLSLYASRTLRKDMERALGEQQFSTVSFMAAEINDELKDRMNALELIASGIDAPLLAKPADLHRYLEQRPILQLLFNAGVFVTGQDGVAVADFPVVAGRVGTNYMDREHVSRVLEEGKSLVSKPIAGRALKGAPSVPISVPIHDKQGKVIGILVGPTDLSRPNFLDKVTSGRYGSSGGYLIIARQYRLIITATEKRFIMTPLLGVGAIPLVDRFINGYEGSGVLVNQFGEERLESTKGIPLASWYVTASLPTAEAFAPIRAMQQGILLATIFLTVLAGGLTWWMLRRQLSPMLAAVKTLAAWSHSDKPAQPLPNTSQDEIGDLIGGFNSLLETLKQRGEALAESEERHRTILQTATDGFWMVDKQGRLLEVNDAYCRMSGYSAQELLTMRISDLEVAEAADDITKITARGDGRFESRHYRKDRSIFEVEVSVKYRALDDGRIVGFLRDITERKRADEARARLAAIVESSNDAIVGYELDRTITSWNAAAERFFGYSAAEAIGQNASLIIPPDLRVLPAQTLEYLVSGLPISPYETERFSKDGRHIPVLLSLSAIRDAHGVIIGISATYSDITERKQMEHQVRQLAFHDTLTKLPNRRLLVERLNQTMAASKRSGRYGALMFLDLDNFKPLNDKHGHEVGDLLLIEAADRLKGCVREVDTVARFGGDEFVVIISELDADRSGSTTQAGIIAEKIRAALAKLYQLRIQQEGKAETIVEHHCTASIGVALFVKDEASQDNILKWADVAMYQAKEAGGNLARFYDPRA